MADQPDYVAMLQKLRESKGTAVKTPPPEPEAEVPEGLGTFVDFVPELYDEDKAWIELNNQFETIGILEVYDRMLGLYREDERGRTESIMVTCPFEGHNENNPSAWVNTEKGTVCCGHFGGGKGSGLNKVGLYCSVRGIVNEPKFFHQIMRMMVWEFRGVDPYKKEESDAIGVPTAQ